MFYRRKPPSPFVDRKYHSTLATLFYLRGLNHSNHFMFASNVDGLGVFGDFVLLFRENQRVTASFFHLLSSSLDGDSPVSSVKERLVYYFTSFRKAVRALPWLEEQFGEEIHDVEIICYTDDKLDSETSYSNADHLVDAGGLADGLNTGAKEWEVFEEMKRFWEFLVDLSCDISEKFDIRYLQESVSVFRSVIGSEEILFRVDNLKLNLTLERVRVLLADIGGEPNKTEFKEFLDKFKIFHSQACEVKLMEQVRDDFLKVCGAQYIGQSNNDYEDEVLGNKLNDIFAAFVTDIFEWVEKGDEWLSRSSQIWTNVIHNVVTTVCDPIMKSVSECKAEFTVDSIEYLSDQILENKIICVDAQSNHTFLNLVKLRHVLQGLEYFMVDVECILKHKNIVVNAIKRYWCSLVVIDTSDAVISNLNIIIQDLSKLQALNTDTRLIFVSGDANEILMPCLQSNDLLYERVIDIVSWVSLTPSFQTWFLNKRVIFQGIETSLGSILSPYPDIFKEFHGHFLYSLLLQHDLIILGSNLPIVNGCIPRTLTRAINFNSAILRSKFSDTLIVITGSNMDEIIEFVPEGENYHCFDSDQDTVETFKGIHIVVLEEGPSEELFKNIISDANMSAHCFLLTGNKLSWKWSLGDMAPLEPHILKEKPAIFHFESASTSPEKISIIVGDPDTGKTTFLSHLAQDTKLSHPSMWVICLNLCHHEEFLNNTKLEDPETLYPLLKEVATYPHHSALSDMLFYHYWLHGNVALFIDGSENIRHLTGEIINMIHQIKNNMKHIFVTCTPKTLDVFVEGLSTFPFVLQPVDSKDQRFYLSQKWRSKLANEKQLNFFVEAMILLLQNSINEEEKKLCSLPFLTTLAATAYDKEVNLFAQTGTIAVPQKVNIVHLYDKYVETQCYEFLTSIADEGSVTQHWLIEKRHKLLDTYKILSVLLLLTKDDLKVIDPSQYDMSKDLTGLKQIVGRGSLVTFVEDTPEFIHKTLTGYFLGMWMADSYSTVRGFIEQRFMDARYTAARLWMDRVLCCQYDLHCAALAGDEAAIGELLSKGADINAFDSGGRTPLHLAASHDHPHIVRLLLRAGADTSQADLVLGWRPLKYADSLRAWASMNLLLEASTSKTLKIDMVFTNGILENDAMLNSLLITACQRGFIHVMEYLHTQGVDVRKVIDFEGSTALHVAAESGQTELVNYLLSRELEVETEGKICHNVLRILKMGMYRGKPDINVMRNDGSTAVLLAAREGHADTLKVLLECGAAVDHRKLDGSTAMHAAVAENRTESVRVLLQAGAGPNGDDDDGTAPLHAAAAEGHAGLVRLLLEYGAEAMAVDKSHATPLHWASAGGHLRCAEALVGEGAVVNAKDEDLRTPLHWAAIEGQSALVRFLLQRGAQPKMVARDGGTAVHYAARDNRPGTLSTFRRQGVDINIVSPDGSTPLHWASHRGRGPAVSRLLEMGAYRDVSNHEGFTPLHLAARKGHASLVRLFLRAGASPDGEGTAQRTPPLLLAAKGEHAACVRVLLEAQASIDAADAIGATALHWAAWSGHEGCVSMILRAGADVAVADHHRASPLHWAAGEGHVSVIQALLRAGAVCSATDRDGETPLHWAAREGHADVVASLLTAGANPIRRNRDGDTASTLATRAQHSDVTKMLEIAAVTMPKETFYDITAEQNVRNEYDTPEGIQRKDPAELRKMSTMEEVDGCKYYDATPRTSHAFPKKQSTFWDEENRKVSLIRMSVGVYEHEKTIDETPEVHKTRVSRESIVRPTSLPIASVASRVRVNSDSSFPSSNSNEDFSSLMSDESTKVFASVDSDVSEEQTMSSMSNEDDDGGEPPPLPSSPIPTTPSTPSGSMFEVLFGAGVSIARYARKAIGSDTEESLTSFSQNSDNALVYEPDDTSHQSSGSAADFIAMEGLNTVKPHASISSHLNENGNPQSAGLSVNQYLQDTCFEDPQDIHSGVAVTPTAGAHLARRLSVDDENGGQPHLINNGEIEITHAKSIDEFTETVDLKSGDDSDASC